jgi:hypothetical protein
MNPAAHARAAGYAKYNIALIRASGKRIPLGDDLFRADISPDD